MRLKMKASNLRKNPESQSRRVIVDANLISESAARAQVESLIFKGKKKPRNKFERAAQKSFMDLVMVLMKDGGRLVKP